MIEGVAAVSARALRRSYDGTDAVRDLTLEVCEGELFALLGPSGCGKTTSLRLIAGFERPDGGELRLWGDLVASVRTFVPPERRGVGMVFQDFALFPHMSVAENVAYGLRRERDRSRRVDEVLELVGLAGFGARSVHELSGGEQQRVALARALAPRPRLLLLDEPFSNLDPALRGRVRAELREIVKRAGTTAVLVTHDQEEALSIADRVGFMWAGRLEQVGAPDEIYAAPRTVEVAEFIGDANVYRLPVADGRVHSPLGSFEVPGPASRAAVMVRPEDVQVYRAGEASGLAGEITAREYFGHDQVLHVRLQDGTPLRVRVGPGERAYSEGPVQVALRKPPRIFALD